MTGDLALTLGTTESSTLEFKRQVSDRDAVRRVVCAFANDLPGAGGGDLLIGVNDHGQPVPVDTSDDALLGLATIRDEGKLLDRPTITVDRAFFAGGPVIHVHVEASRTPPVRLDGVAWVRTGPLTVRASANDERVLAERGQAASLPFDARAMPGTGLPDLDAELLRSTYVTAAVDPDVLAENGRPVDQQFRSLKLLAADGRATGLGVLLGGMDPTSLLPGAYIQFVRYAGVDSAAEVVDDEELRENLITATTRLTPLLKAYNTRRLTDVGQLRERPSEDYPEPALREAIVNALVHRTFEASNSPVRVLWFDDRIEISNPGGPFGTVDSQNFDRVNDYRNPSLAAAMKTLGYVNRFGRGIERMRLEMARNGNPPPEFEITDAFWITCLRSRS